VLQWCVCWWFCWWGSLPLSSFGSLYCSQPLPVQVLLTSDFSLLAELCCVLWVYCILEFNITFIFFHSRYCGLVVKAGKDGFCSHRWSSATLVNTYVPLSPNRIIWYRPMGGAVKVTVGLALHWPRVTDSSGSPLKARSWPSHSHNTECVLTGVWLTVSKGTVWRWRRYALYWVSF